MASLDSRDKRVRNKNKQSLNVEPSTSIKELSVVNGACPHCEKGITDLFSLNSCYWCGGKVSWSLYKK